MGVVWGLPYLLIRVTVRQVDPALLVFVRTAGGALLLAPFVLRRGHTGRMPVLAGLLRRWRPLLAYTVAEMGVPWLLLFSAERRLSSSLAGLLIAAVPIVGAVLAQLTGTDRLDRSRVTGLVLGMAGVAALVGFDVGASSAWAASSLAVVACGYALGPWILSRYLSGLPAIEVVAASLVLCALAYTPALAFVLPTGPLSGEVAASMVGLTVLCTALAFVLFFALIGEVGALRATVITYVNPAVAVVLGVGLLGERFSVGTALGFVLVLAGSYLATRSPRSTPPPTAPAVAEP